MEWLVFVGFVVVVVFLALSRRGSSSSDFPYEAQQEIFSAAERSFFGVISKAVGKDALVLGKVRIADVIKPKKGMTRGDWQKAFNKISAKHFDFVICTPDSLSVIAVVELDDSSHAKKKRIQRDKFIEGACSSAGITLHRIKADSAYSQVAIKELIFPPQFTDESEFVAPEKLDVEQVSVPSEGNEQHARCPKCSSELVRKVANKGKHKGTEFLACSAFPKCRYIETPKL